MADNNNTVRKRKSKSRDGTPNPELAPSSPISSDQNNNEVMDKIKQSQYKNVGGEIGARDREEKRQEIIRKIQASSRSMSKMAKIWKSAFIIVTALSFITRFWGISEPSQVVFDEVHFGKFASYYLRRTYYFDVHPPLGKLLLAAAGYLVGYDGHFLFDNIGDDYIKNNVPYVAMRALPATAGALVAPFAFLTMKEMGVSISGAIFAAVLITFDNALITQSRLILLDSMLMLFCVTSVYCWVRFFKLRYSPFTYMWWKWLILTGVSLSFAVGIKMVGLFVVATVGIGVLCDLWRLLDIKRGLSIRQFLRHFAARTLALIILPTLLYLFFFWIHFAILTQSGPGDAFMSPGFQATLSGNEMHTASVGVTLNSNVTIKSKSSSMYLHSHLDRYPLRYEDGRVSSQGQQVTAYPHNDTNNVWSLRPVHPELYNWTYAKPEGDHQVQYLRHGDLVRLFHIKTESWLITHDVASPLTPTHMEMTTLKTESENDTTRYNETIWRIDIIDGKEGMTLRSKSRFFKLINIHHDVAVNLWPSVLPAWGFGQNEVNGNKNLLEPSSIWYIESVEGGAPENETKVEKKEPDEEIPTPSFLAKFLELQSLMISHNAGLTKSHPYQSSPISWPFSIRGISFWEKKEGLKQIYLLGNPIGWLGSILGIMFFMSLWGLDRILLRRGQDEFGKNVRRWWDRSVGFLILAWVLHYIPFFPMGRALFLHHYLPSSIFGMMACAGVVEFMGRMLSFPANPKDAITPEEAAAAARPAAANMFWQGSKGYIVVLTLMSSLVIISFWYMAPLTYGWGFPSVEILRSRKLLSSWDLQYA